jgi:hypothetical protein
LSHTTHTSRCAAVERRVEAFRRLP